MNLLNGTHVDKNDPTVGALRWQLYTESFVTGMRDHPSLHIKSKINPWSPENRMKLVNNLPHLAEKVFYTEAKSWLTTKYKPVWPGHCPGAVPNGQDPKDYIVEVINLGVDHLDKSHTGQALQCWTDALRVLESNKNYKTSLRDAYSVVTGNMRALRQLRYSEMVINENKDSLDYLQYDDKHFQEESVPRPRPEKSSGPNGMMSLEDINEEIIRLEDRLKNLKASRDKMLELSKNFAKNYPRDLGYDSARLTKREL